MNKQSFEHFIISLQDVLKAHMGFSRHSLLIAVGRKYARKIFANIIGATKTSAFKRLLRGLPWEIHVISRSKNKIILKGQAQVYDKSSIMPKCHFLRGFLMESAFLSYKKAFSCKEISCKALGDSECIFELSAMP
jgi:predicted hydrocarbon binding protein